MTRGAPAQRVVIGFLVTSVLLAVALLRVLLSLTDPANTSAPGYMGLAYAATAVLLAVVVVGAFVRRADVRVGAGFPWLVGGVSLLVSLVPWWAIWTGNAALGGSIYSGLRVPQGIVQFWDLLLPMQSIDCASVGVDVYAANNGCLAEPTIYAPGVLWLQWVPFDLFSARYVTGLGVLGILLSSLALLWLARNSSGLGQIVLLVAAVGGPWLLLLERGNLDAVVIWVAVAAVILVRRWDSLWAWWVAAALFWLMGTWKYYPFAMGLMLVPALRLHRGWTVLVGYAIAVVVFVAVTWETFRFSSASNSNMIDYGDPWVLGRVPVVARMLGTEVGAGGLQLGDLLLFALSVAAVLWGVAVGASLRGVPWRPSMLAIAGSSMFMVSVLVAGFGWAYKAVFLLLAVPLVSGLARSRSAAVVSSSVTVLLLTGVSAVVVWNTVLATLAGIIIAGFALGLSGTVLVRSVRHRSASAANSSTEVVA